jgi:hypothetical protein
MSTTLIQSANMPPALVTGAVGPQTSTASTVVVTGAEIDSTQCRALSYTAICATNAIKWSVFGANVSDYSDEVAVKSATTISGGANDSYSVSPPPFRYYRVKVVDDSGGTHGTITVNGVAKG